MNNLKCLKQGFNKLECKKDKTRKVPSNCANCPYKEYKSNSSNSTNLKIRTSKQAKLEKKRTSLFTDDLDHCIICGKSPVNLHEIFGGSRNRKNSIKFKLVIPLCTCEHHNQVECKGIHFNKELRKEWQIKGQLKFEKTYPNLKFEDIFRKNYK